MDYGTNPNNLNQSQTVSGLVTSHNVQLTGLNPNTTYYYRVTSADAASNSSTEPPDPGQPPASFTTPSASFTDTTVSDFSAGTTGSNTYVSETGNGEVILKPTEGQEFSGGPGLPAGWTGCTWPACSDAPGPATVSGGSLHVDGGMAKHQRHLRVRPRGRVQGDLRRRSLPAPRPHRQLQQLLGDVQHAR